MAYRCVPLVVMLSSACDHTLESQRGEVPARQQLCIFIGFKRHVNLSLPVLPEVAISKKLTRRRVFTLHERKTQNVDPS